MSLTEAREQQLIALIGRVEELEKEKASPDYALMSYVDKLFPLPKTGIKETLSADKYLRHTDPSLVVLDCDGGERTVRLPGASKGNRYFIIVNNSS